VALVQVILTRIPADNRRLKDLLEPRGFPTVDYPCVDFRFLPYRGGEVDGRGLDDFEAVAFTSRRAVQGIAGVPHLFRDRPAIIGAVGRGCAEEVVRILGRQPDVVSPRGTGEELGRLLAARLSRGSPVLHVRGSMTTGHLRDALVSRGLEVFALVVYENVAPPLPPLKLAGRAVGVFASPSAARRFFQVNQDLADRLDCVAIGPTTEAELRRLGATRVQVASQPTPEELARAVEELIERRKDDQNSFPDTL